jgi:hypothetical protein
MIARRNPHTGQGPVERKDRMFLPVHFGAPTGKIRYREPQNGRLFRAITCLIEVPFVTGNR